MNVPQAFADIALNMSAVFGAGFHDAHVISQGDLAHDAGGSVIAGSGSVTYRSCSAQVDAATEAMRQADGFTEQDRRILVLSATLEGEITAADKIELLEGPFAGMWMIASVSRDPAAVYFECRARRA